MRIAFDLRLTVAMKMQQELDECNSTQTTNIPSISRVTTRQWRVPKTARWKLRRLRCQQGTWKEGRKGGREEELRWRVCRNQNHAATYMPTGIRSRQAAKNRAIGRILVCFLDELTCTENSSARCRAHCRRLAVLSALSLSLSHVTAGMDDGLVWRCTY